jgi:hypothetical protein
MGIVAAVIISGCTNTRVGSAITKEENGEFFVMYDGRWQKAGQQLYKNMQNYQPEYRIQFKDYQWIMTYVDKSLGPPQRIEIKIDANSRVIEEFKKYDK